MLRGFCYELCCEVTSITTLVKDSTPTRAVDDARRALHEEEIEENQHHHVTIGTGKEDVHTPSSGKKDGSGETS